MVFIVVSRCAITLGDLIIASVLMVMNLTMMATHAVVSSFCMHACIHDSSSYMERQTEQYRLIHGITQKGKEHEA